MSAVGISIRTVAILFNAFISHTIGAEGLGLYTIVSTVYGFSVVFATSGISLTVTRLVAAANGEGRESHSSSILHILLLIIVYAMSVKRFSLQHLRGDGNG